VGENARFSPPANAHAFYTDRLSVSSKVHDFFGNRQMTEERVKSVGSLVREPHVTHKAVNCTSTYSHKLL